MPVGRVILKSISESKKLPKLKTDGARLLYTWLITHLDKNGCFSGDAQVINGKVFTRLSKSNKTVEGFLQDLEGNGLIIRYQINGDIFLNVPDFIEKQPNFKPEREGKTNIPLPTQDIIRTNSGLNPLNISKDNISKDNVAFKLSEYLFEKIRENNPDHKEPNFENWAKHIDLMIKIDKRTPDRIKEVIDWCQKDNFWYKNILSTKKLREKFDQLILNMGKNKKGDWKI